MREPLHGTEAEVRERLAVYLPEVRARGRTGAAGARQLDGVGAPDTALLAAA